MPNHELLGSNVPLKLVTVCLEGKGLFLFISKYLQHALRSLLLCI